MPESALLIVNPNSCTGATAELGDGIAVLDRAGIEIIRKESEGPDNVSQLIGEYRDRVDVIILGGGDGTISSATDFDNRLRLFSIKPQSAWELLARAPFLRGGRHRAVDGVFHASGERVEVDASPSQEVFADGEPVSQTPAVFEVIPDAIEVIVPVSKLADATAAGDS